MTVVMNCFRCSCIPLHSHWAFCIISHDAWYPSYKPNGGVYYVRIFELVFIGTVWLLFLKQYMPISATAVFKIHISYMLQYILNTQHM